MSLLDQVRKLEQQVVDRLKELEPLTREYEQLRKVAERFGIKYSPGSAEASAEAEPSATARGGDTRATARSARTPAKAKARRSPARARAAKPASKPRDTRSTTGPRANSAKATRASGSVAPTSRAKRAQARGQRRAAAARPGQRNDDVLRLVRENPGITVREIGERLGVDATGLYRVVKRLTDDGRLRKDGTRLHPVEPATASAPASPAADASPTVGTADAAEVAVPAASPDADASASADK
jgi:hypothetical protein